jgi:hypothetical protein
LLRVLSRESPLGSSSSLSPLALSLSPLALSLSPLALSLSPLALSLSPLALSLSSLALSLSSLALSLSPLPIIGSIKERDVRLSRCGRMRLACFIPRAPSSYIGTR